MTTLNHLQPRYTGFLGRSPLSSGRGYGAAKHRRAGIHECVPLRGLVAQSGHTGLRESFLFSHPTGRAALYHNTERQAWWEHARSGLGDTRPAKVGVCRVRFTDQTYASNRVRIPTAPLLEMA